MTEHDRERAVGPTEAAIRLGVSTRTVQRWLREGRLASVKVGGRLKVNASAFEPTEPTSASDSDGGTAAPSGPIRRLLIANRGELVVRIARTCRELGITAIALVPADQSGAWWAQQIPERIALEGTYLDGDAVLRAARAARADALHPGYGFLAENADFAEAVERAGIRWVGPSHAAMRALGDKAAGRRVALQAGVPVVPGYDGDEQSDDELRRQAQRIGFPLLVKPSAGGGGKGMHEVRADATLSDLLAQARREAMTAFGSDRLVLERLIERPRHVEIQVLADTHGNAVHLGERDCSLQRRHQKVIEEAPSPAVSAELRTQLGDAALRLVAAAGYTNAGTVEFLLDESGAFYFLEVNARLQVEHPVTEAVTGRDLVADQLRIAAGDPLGFDQADVHLRGHAMEARLYAEDPWHDFLPTTGRAEAVHWPQNVRIDAGVGAGDVIGTRYDPLLAKIISVANDRATARDALATALDGVHVLGVTTNRAFLSSILRTAEFREGRVTTDLIERTWKPRAAPAEEDAFPLAVAVLASIPAGEATTTVTPGFRLNAAPRMRLRSGETEASAAAAGVPLPGTAMTLAPEASGGAVEVVVDLEGIAVRARLADPPSVAAAVAQAQGGGTGPSRVVAPMPGVVLQVLVAAGDAVAAGQHLIVLEAMKMENAVSAPSAGTITALRVATGQQVQRGDILVELG